MISDEQLKAKLKKRYDKRYDRPPPKRPPGRPRGDSIARKTKHGIVQENGLVFVAKYPEPASANPEGKGLGGSTPKHFGAKKKRGDMLIAYLGNTVNPWPESRAEYCGIAGLKCKSSYIYKLFTAAELDDIESKALDNRRKCYSPRLSKVDDALFKTATTDGKAPEVKLVYERFEGWSPKTPPPVSVSPVIVFPIAPLQNIEDWQRFITNNNLKENTLLTQDAGVSNNTESAKEAVIDIPAGQ